MHTKTLTKNPNLVLFISPYFKSLLLVFLRHTCFSVFGSMKFQADPDTEVREQGKTEIFDLREPII